jgi:hypothetical protein
VYIWELMGVCSVSADAVPGAQPHVVRLSGPCNAKLHVHKSRDGREWDTSNRSDAGPRSTCDIGRESYTSTWTRVYLWDNVASACRRRRPRSTSIDRRAIKYLWMYVFLCSVYIFNLFSKCLVLLYAGSCICTCSHRICMQGLSKPMKNIARKCESEPRILTKGFLNKNDEHCHWNDVVWWYRLWTVADSRGFMTQNGQPDNARASRYILKDFVKGKLLYCHAPPNHDQSQYHKFPERTKQLKAASLPPLAARLLKVMTAWNM